jgi:Spy/CpxP family protein refolding chaperone
MNRHRTLSIAAFILAAFSFAPLESPAQQTSPDPAAPGAAVHAARAAQPDVPSVELQLKTLTEKLELTRHQQALVKPILQQLQDATLKIVNDTTLSHDDQLAAVRPYRYKVRDQLCAILSDDQKKKLDEYFQGPHSEMHGSLTGSPSPQP